jgi:hypothetical protein
MAAPLHRTSLLVVATNLAFAGCHHGADAQVQDAGIDSNEYDQLLAMRMVDYSAALKAAALRLTGDAPTLTEIRQVADAPQDGTHAAYQALVRDYLARPAFARQMLYFWRDTFKIGGTPALDTAPALAAKLTVENGSYTELLTRTYATCPTFDEATSTFRDAECTNGGPRAGVLTDPGVMAAFNSSFAFRRVRWVQETFGCARFPVEISGPPRDVGGILPYLGDWPFGSVASPTTGGRINFQDVESTVCMNCHQTINHIAPLFAYYDQNGAYQPAIAVPTPFDGPTATLEDYLPTTETTAWRFGRPVTDLPALGAAMAADPDVQRCAVARIWNWALGKTDIVDAQQDVPTTTIQAQISAFSASGFKLKDLIFAVFDSEDFVRY